MAGKDETRQHLSASATGCAEESARRQPPQPPPGSSEGGRGATGDERDTGRLVHAEQLTARKAEDTEAPRGLLDRTLQAQLGRQLRSIYADIASEPVPERFIKLLQELEAKEKRQ